MPRKQPFRPVGLFDIAARCTVAFLPRAWNPRVDQARLDLRAVLDGIQGHHERPYSDPHGGPRPPFPLARIDPVRVLLPPAYAARYQALLRDMAMIAGGLAGRHPPPFSRPPRATNSAPRAQPRSPLPRTLRVVRVEHPTAHAVTLFLQSPSGSPTPFLPGQFLTVFVEIDGRTHRRAYSICSVPGPSSELAITVKRAADGVVSGMLNDHAREGMALRVLGPSGSFTWDPQKQGQSDLVLVAAGSGITPIMSILRTALAELAPQKIALLYGNRAPDDILFRRELDELARTHGSRLSVRHVLTRAQGDDAAEHGRIDRSRLGVFLSDAGIDVGQAHFYVCGPEGLMSEVQEGLRELGVEPGRVHVERFATPHLNRGDSPPAGRPQPVTVRGDGLDRVITVRPEQTLLEAGLEAGLPFKFSCTMGGCGACRVRVHGGAVHMGEPNALTPSEKTDGWALACIARPAEPLVVELK